MPNDVTTADNMTEADKAVAYLLDRIQQNADAFHYCGPGTETFRLLCIAEAARTGKPFDDVENMRRRFVGRGVAEVIRLRREVDEADDDWSDEIDPPPPKPTPPAWIDCGELGRWATNGHFAVREGERAEDRTDWFATVDMAGFLAKFAPAGPAVVTIGSSRKTHGGVEVVRVERNDMKADWFATEYFDRFAGCDVLPTGEALGVYVCKRGDQLVGVLMPRRVE